MNKIGWLFAKIKSKIFRNNEYMTKYYRRQGCNIGTGCLICSNIASEGKKEAYLITIGDNVTIAGNVAFITHDYSIHHVVKGKSVLYGKIIIGNNCFIGHGSILLPGIRLENNIIVAAGSVVTKSFLEPNIIIGGNPAKKIGDYTSFRERYEKKATNEHSNQSEIKKSHMACDDYLINK